MGEVWKKIEGWDEYSVSSYGNVKRDKKKSGAYLKLSKRQSQDKTGKKINYNTYWVSLSNNGYSNSLCNILPNVDLPAPLKPIKAILFLFLFSLFSLYISLIRS